MVDAKDPHVPTPKITGRVVGFVDTEEAFFAIVKALREEGIKQGDIVVYHGEGSKELMHENRGTFFLGDAEQTFLDQAAQQLDAGHFALSVKVENRDQGMHIAKVAERYGAHSFSHYGTWVNERLTK